MSQFVKIFPTYGGADNLEARINDVLAKNPAAKVVRVEPVGVEKIGGNEVHALVVFEEEETP